MLLSATPSAAQAANEVEDAQSKLTLLTRDLTNLEYFAERSDLGRIMVLKKRIETVSQSIKSAGLGNIQTLNRYEELVLSFRYSESFLYSISTQRTQATISDIRGLNDEIIKSRGFDKSIVTQLVAGVLSQMHNLTEQIGRETLPGDLERWFKTAFNPSLGPVLATARADGDVPHTYQEANKIYALLKSQYVALYKVPANTSAYNMITELVGLNEFYWEISNRGFAATGGTK
jgi:hypothetical protein